MNKQIRASLERPDIFDGDSLFVYNYATKFTKGKRVLDIGTGYGFGADYLLKKGAKQVVGIDFDDHAVTNAKKLFTDKNLQFKKMDATKLRLPFRSFDVVVAFEVIEHLKPSDHRTFLKQVKNILSPGGIFVLSTPNKLAVSPGTEKPTNPYHFKEYTHEELLACVIKTFPHTDLLGMKNINKEFIDGFNKLDKSKRYKLFKVFGKFKLARDLVSILPKRVRMKISGEDSLPKRGLEDYSVDKKNIDESRNLITISINKV